jgi:hypothetical protein
VPNQLRGVIWQLLSGSRELRLRNLGLFENARPPRLIRCPSFARPMHTHHHAFSLTRPPPRTRTHAQLLEGTTAYEVDIIRDVSRTYPNHIHYCQRHGLGQRQLFRVLKAYALYDPEVGYVQGMGYIAAIFLMYMAEDEAFWLLVALLKGAAGHEPLEGLFTPGLPLVQLCFHQLEGLLAVRIGTKKKRIARIIAHIPHFCVCRF